VLGDRLIRRPQRQTARARNFWSEVPEPVAGRSGGACGHHGIGRYLGMEASRQIGDGTRVSVVGICRKTPKLYLPVENIELLSKYGHEEGSTGLNWRRRRGSLRRRNSKNASALWRTKLIRHRAQPAPLRRKARSTAGAHIPSRQPAHRVAFRRNRRRRLFSTTRHNSPIRNLGRE